MIFREAMDALKSGKKITREGWKDGLYFVMEGLEVHSYQPVLEIYQYNESIMVSDGWIVDGETEPKSFGDVIESLQKGKKVRLKEWSKDFYVMYDTSNKQLIIHKMSMFPYHPNFDDFRAIDWIEI